MSIFLIKCTLYDYNSFYYIWCEEMKRKIIFLLILDYLYPNNKKESNSKMLFAITVHNIPEGMAVGVTLAGAISGDIVLTMAGALVLSIGIAIQNFPEGAIISMPLKKEGFSKKKAFLYGFISGVFELLGTLITLIFTNFIVAIMPYMLAIAAGAMMYVIVVELIPESNHKSKLNVVGFLIGFIIMMVLDVILG